MKTFRVERIGLDRADLNILDADTSEMASSIMTTIKELKFYDYKFDEKEIEEALSWLQNTAKNPDSKDYFRHLFASLVVLTDVEHYSDSNQDGIIL